MTPDTDELRHALAEAIAAMPLKEAGHVLLDVSRAVLDRSAACAPSAIDLMRLATRDGLFTVVVARGPVAPMLAEAHDALKQVLVDKGKQ